MTTVKIYMLINKEVKILWQMCEQPKNTVVFLYLDYFKMVCNDQNSSQQSILKDMAKLPLSGEIQVPEFMEHEH